MSLNGASTLVPGGTGYRNPIRKRPSSTSRVNTEACQTYATCRLGTRAKASDQSARVSDEIVVLVCPGVRLFR